MDMTEVERWQEYVRIRDKEISRLNRALSRATKESQTLRATFRHIHVNNGLDDACRQCGLDLRNPIHQRRS
jgi:predicted RNase H-like nuclease (RuvC/YqgF family)